MTYTEFESLCKSLPVPYNEDILVLDSTKIADFLRCPRYYFFRHVLGWTPSGINIDLGFGKAVHCALEVLYNIIKDGGMYQKKDLIPAADAFLKSWRADFEFEVDETHPTKNPSAFGNLLKEYFEEYKDKDNFEVITTEAFDAVAIDEHGERLIYYKIDAICFSGERGYFALEHKTSGSDNPTYRDAYYLRTQTFTYTHALYSLCPPEQVYGVIINLLISRKQGNLFMRQPLPKKENQMADWLWSINDVYNDIEFEFESLASCKADDVVLTCFKKNPEGCIAYNRTCPYHDFCIIRTNPLSYDEVPSGIDIKFWNPAKEFAMETGKGEKDGYK